MTNKEKMLKGVLYLATDKELTDENMRAKEVILEASQLIDNELRTNVYKQLINTTGAAHFGMGLKFDYGIHISVGNNFYCNYDCILIDVCPITFGDNCMLGPNVQIYTATHPLDEKLRNSGLEYGKPISFGNSVWIGGGVIVLPGVTIGNNVVIAAGSVVTKSFGDNVLIGGNPAKVLKAI